MDSQQRCYAYTQVQQQSNCRRRRQSCSFPQKSITSHRHCPIQQQQPSFPPAASQHIHQPYRDTTINRAHTTTRLPPLSRVLTPHLRLIAALPVTPILSSPPQRLVVTPPGAPITLPLAPRVGAAHRREDAHVTLLPDKATIINSNTSDITSLQAPLS